MPQARRFQITSVDRHGRDALVTILCERHGVECARDEGIVMNEETRIRQLSREVRHTWGRIKITARPLKPGETVECEWCEEGR